MRIFFSSIILFVLIPSFVIADVVLPEYKILNEDVYEKPGKAQVILDILVSGKITENNLKALLNKLYASVSKRTGFKYHTHPTVIGIYLYTSKKNAKHSIGFWIAKLSKLPSDTKPKIKLKKIQIQHLAKIPKKKFKLAETNNVSSVELQLKVQFKESNNGLILYGKTNLPNGTKLGASVKKDGYGAQDFKIYVNGGVFSSAQFTDRGTPLSGEYEVSLFTHFNKSWQNNDVLRKLKNYTGTQIKNGKLEVINKITLGKNLSKESRTKINQNKQQGIENNLKTKKIWQAAHELLRHGKNMERLRNSVGMQQCMKKMQRLQPEVKELRAQVDSLEIEPKTLLLAEATAWLEICVTCVESFAMKKCNEAEMSLEQAKQ